MSIERDIPLMQRAVTGSGEPLVLMPGGLTGWRSWKPHAETLSVSRQVIRLQLLSVEYGLADRRLPADYSLDFEISALRRTLDELAIAQADFAGWSYGAATSLSFALHNPDRVRSLTLIEPPACWVLRSRGLFPGPLREQQRFMQALASNDVSEEQLVRFAHNAGLVARDVDPRTLPQWPVWLEHRQSLRMGDAACRHEDDIELVRAFEKPVLLVKGEGSTAEMHTIIDILAEEFPHAQAVMFPGAHAPHIVSMQPFMERFTRFLATR